jgi:hypothetical protein
MQLGRSSSSAASLSLSLHYTGVFHRSFSLFLGLSACLIVVVCYYTKDVVCLSIKDINLLIKETGVVDDDVFVCERASMRGSRKGVQ